MEFSSDIPNPNDSQWIAGSFLATQETGLYTLDNAAFTVEACHCRPPCAVATPSLFNPPAMALRERPAARSVRMRSTTAPGMVLGRPSRSPFPAAASFRFFSAKASFVRTLQKVCADIVSHFYSTIDPLGMKAQVVVYDRGLCVAYHQELTRQLQERARAGAAPDEAAVVMSVQPKDDSDWQQYRLTDDKEEALLNRFRQHGDPLKFLIVASKLGTGFDAPIEGVMYLDKPMKLHTLYKTITRTNRNWKNPVTGQEKRYGLIVDYVGLGDGFAGRHGPG